MSDPAVPEEFQAEDLDARRIRGYLLALAVAAGTFILAFLDEKTTLFLSSRKNRAYRVVREWTNVRGTMATTYACSCPDFTQYGRTDCEHVFCERIRRGEAVVVGEIPKDSRDQATVGRRPPRKRFAADGRTYGTAQRHARVKMPNHIPELLVSLKRAYDRDQEERLDERPDLAEQLRKGQASAATRALTLLFKIANGTSYDETLSIYQHVIDAGMLPLKRPPHQNTLALWMNDPAITPVLVDMLAITARPFRKREYAAMIDETKISQMRSAHARGVYYDGDIRDDARWMACHALVGVETMIVMAVAFSLDRGKGTHETKFVERLIKAALPIFRIRILLADKAYLSEEILGWLSTQCGIKAFIPVKKRWNFKTKKKFYDVCKDLVQLYTNDQKAFQEVYRFRVKIESLFSHLKDVADGFMWSRGRWNKEARNANQPCTAWINEALCKFIYVNLRTTTTTEEVTGYQVDYMVRGFFFPPADEPAIDDKAA